MFFKGIILAVVSLILDQISKIYVFTHVLSDKNYVEAMPFLNWVRVYNNGISFGMFSNNQYSQIIFSVLSGIIVIVLLFSMYKARNKFIIYAYALIIGGAVGNVIDRIRIGAVMDFIDVYVGQYHWPAFNVADSTIFIGAFMLLISSVIYKEDL
jgi:signal peptidase II